MDQITAISQRLGEKACLEHIEQQMRESRFLRDVRRAVKTEKLAIEYGRLEVSKLPTMEGPPFPDFHTITLTQSVRIHRFTGETSPKC